MEKIEEKLKQDAKRPAFLKTIIITLILVSLIWGLTYAWQDGFSKACKYFFNLKDDYKGSLIFAAFYTVLVVFLVWYFKVNVDTILG